MEVLCVFLLMACYFDYRYRKIPNLLLGIMLVHGLAVSFGAQEWQGVLFFLLQALLLLGLLYPLFKLGMLGAGDVKLFGICAGYFSYDRIVYFLFVSMLLAAIVSLFKLIIEQNASERFAYLGDYFWEVMRTGQWQLYADNRKDDCSTAIPLAGPVLVSVLLYIGGAY